MYKLHKIIQIFVFIFISLLSFFIKIDYSSIASDSIEVVSIALAVYLAAYAGLQGDSNLAKSLRTKEDKKVKTKTQLGVFNSYIKTALLIGLSTIVISFTIIVIDKYFSLDTTITIKTDWYYVLSSISFALFALNLVLICLIGRFIINRISWDK